MSAHCWRWTVSAGCVPVWDIWSTNRGRWESRSTLITNFQRRGTVRKRRGKWYLTHRAFIAPSCAVTDSHPRAHSSAQARSNRRTFRVELRANHCGERPLDERDDGCRDHEVVRHDAHRPHERGDHRVADETGQIGRAA